MRLSEPRGDWAFVVIVVDDVSEIIVVLVDVDVVVIHTFSHFSHAPPPHVIEFILIHVLVVLAIEERHWSPSPGISESLLLIQSLIDLHPLIHAELILLVIVNSYVFVVIEFILPAVVLLHVLKEVFSFDLVLRVVESVTVIDVLLNELLPNTRTFFIVVQIFIIKVALILTKSLQITFVNVAEQLICFVIVSL